MSGHGKIVTVLAAALAVCGAATAAALVVPGNEPLGQRAGITADRAGEPESRLGGKRKAVALILEGTRATEAERLSAPRKREEIHDHHLSGPSIGPPTCAIVALIALIAALANCFGVDRVRAFRVAA